MDTKQCDEATECFEGKPSMEGCAENSGTEQKGVTIDEYITSTANMINERIKTLGPETPNADIFTMFSNLVNTYVKLVDMQREMILELHRKLVDIQAVLTPAAQTGAKQVEN